MNILIDVRTAEEYAEKHADGAVNIPIADIMAGSLGALEGVEKSTPLRLYCHSGARAERARGLLGLAGFTDVVNLGGIDAVIS